MLSRSERFLPPREQADSEHAGRERRWTARRMDGWMSDREEVWERVRDGQRERERCRKKSCCFLLPWQKSATLILSFSSSSLCGFLNSSQVKMQACILNHVNFCVARQVWTFFLFSFDVFVWISWWEGWPVRMTLLYLVKSSDCY